MKQFLLQMCIVVFASTRSFSISYLEPGDSTSKSKYSGLLCLANKNVWRGIDFGNGAPTVQGMLTYTPVKQFDVNILGVSALTGTNSGYANTLNFFANYRVNRFTISLDDYYFHGDDSNIRTNYWDYKNAHFLELRLSYAFKGWEFKAGYTLFGGGFYNNPVIDSSGTVLNNTKGLYLEGSYKFTDFLTLTIGGITAPSALNFMDKSGITNIGVKYSKAIPINEHFVLPLDISIIVNPNHQNIAPGNQPRIGYGNQKVHFVVNLTLQ